MTDLPITGGCNCGAVRFEISQPLLEASYCHCKRCQRRGGAAASPNATRRRARSGWSRARTVCGSWKPEDGMEKWFCGDCGSSVFSSRPDGEAAGADGRLRRPPGVRPTLRQFVAYAASWEEIPDDGLPRHPERRPT